VADARAPKASLEAKQAILMPPLPHASLARQTEAPGTCTRIVAQPARELSGRLRAGCKRRPHGRQRHRAWIAAQYHRQFGDRREAPA